MKKFYLTTPLYYPNARLHAGHVYTTLACDALARYKRLCGYEVAFLTGTDEHGEKLERAAAQAGLTPQAFVAGKRQSILNLWKLLDVHFSHFIYTDRADHTRSVQRLLLKAQKAGYVYKGHYEGRYCVYDVRFISDGSEPANCDVCGRPAELISEENYFFKLSAFQDRLLRLYEEQPAFVQPDFRRNEVVSLVKSGLRDISISRKRIRWGIPWPGDPEQVFYVWYDALTGYLTGIGFAEGEQGSAEFHKYWPADLHMIGKDILRFHAVYWPAFLMAANVPLPKSVFAHGWLLVGQEKMSKSKGNSVYVEPIVQLFREETRGIVAGSDVLRYYELRDIPFGQDSSISYEGLLQRYNSDLANDLGNLANRTVTMINRYFDGVVPETSEPLGLGSKFPFPVAANSAKTACERHFDGCSFSRALEAIWQLIATTNYHLNEIQPWAIAEDTSRRRDLRNVLRTAAEVLRFVSILLYPVIPHGAERLWQQLGCEDKEGKLENQQLDQLDWEGGLKPGTKVMKPEIIFPRLDKEAALARLRHLEQADRGQEERPKEVEATVEPQSPSEQKISIEDFAKVDMRVGQIVSAERVPGAQKLLKLSVDIGSEVRQLVAGIAEHYEPEKLVGMKVVVVTNLQPRKLRGIESNGMIVAASVGEEGRPVLVTFKEEVPNGARLK
jgi:methionyl-tRNA synthetase